MRGILLAVALGAVAPAAAQDNAATMGRSLSTISQVPLKARNGARITLGSRIQRGKPTLISVWASWCPPCIAEAPYLDAIRKHLGSGYNFVYVNRSDGDPDPDQPAAAITQYLARAGLSDLDYVTADVKAYERIVGKDMRDIPDGKVGIPRVYLFDRNGRQIYTTYGFQPSDGADLERRVQQAIGK